MVEETKIKKRTRKIGANRTVYGVKRSIKRSIKKSI
jgi:hypothetical protein